VSCTNCGSDRNEAGDQRIEHVVGLDASIAHGCEIEPASDVGPDLPDDLVPNSPSCDRVPPVLISGRDDRPSRQRDRRIRLDESSAAVSWGRFAPDSGPTLLQQRTPHGDRTQLVRRHRQGGTGSDPSDRTVGVALSER
jgi:hypothetical protein